MKFPVTKTSRSEGKVLRLALSTSTEFEILINFGPNVSQDISTTQDSHYLRVKLHKRNKFMKLYPGVTTIDIPITVMDLDSGYLSSGYISVHIN